MPNLNFLGLCVVWFCLVRCGLLLVFVFFVVVLWCVVWCLVFWFAVWWLCFGYVWLGLVVGCVFGLLYRWGVLIGVSVAEFKLGWCWNCGLCKLCVFCLRLPETSYGTAQILPCRT